MESINPFEEKATKRSRQTTSINGTSIDDVPSELLGPIVGLLPYKDRINVAGVSVRWHNVVDRILGRKLFIGKSCQFTPDDEERYKHQYVPIDTINSVGVNTCYFGEVIDPVLNLTRIGYYWMKFKESIFGPDIPKFKYPGLVKNMFFDGPIPARFFEAVIRPVKNLERIDIHLSALCCLIRENLEFPYFNYLNTLNVWGHKLTQGFFTTFYSSTTVVPNLITLFDHNYFPSLKTLGMEYPFDLREESNVSDSFFEFLLKHKSTLERLKVSVNLVIAQRPDGVETAEDRSWLHRSKQTSKALKLKSLDINISALYRVKLMKIWLAFAESQTILEDVIICVYKLSRDLLYKIVEKNFTTLKSILLTRLIIINEEGQFTPISCSAFSSCTSLQSLFLEGMPTGLRFPSLVDLDQLPPSLKKLELGCLSLLTSDCRVILIDNPNLEDVYLGDVGHAEELGVTMEILNEFIQARRKHSLCLFSSINGTFPQDGIPNGDPDDPVSIVKKSFGTLDIVLNPNGYYVTMPTEPLVLTMDDMDD